MTRIASVSVRLATKDDAHLPAYDHTKLSNGNMCPTWGILRYQMHKTNSGAGRAMALELGSAAHECFAAMRLHHVAHDLGLGGLAKYHGRRLFGQDRWSGLETFLGHDKDRGRLNLALETLYTSGFHDDPSDKRRTITNLEEALIAYNDRWNVEKYPVWVRDVTDPASDCGVEFAFDLVVCFVYKTGDTKVFRLIGRVDGIHRHHERHHIVVQENKTASRLNEAWSMSWSMSHQVTMYCLAAQVFTQEACSDGQVIGLCIPLPRSYDYGGFTIEPVRRDGMMFTQFFDWVDHTISIYEQFENNPYDAPKYTHSCNRYYRPCSLIGFCTADDEEKHELVSLMDDDEWSPLVEEHQGE